MTRAVTPIAVVRGSAEPCLHCDVRQRSVCSAVADADLDRLASVAVVRSYERGKTFIAEGEPAEHFFNITSGTAKLFKLLPDGRQHVTGFASVAHFLGLAVSDTYAFSAKAIEPTSVCRFSRSKLRILLDDYPALEQRLLKAACDELVIAHDQMLTLGRKTAQERVASFLVAWSRTALCGHPCAGLPGDRVPLPMTRGEIADHLGLTIETVSRTFSRFRMAGRIRTPSNTDVVILDRPWLEELAAGTG